MKTSRFLGPLITATGLLIGTFTGCDFRTDTGEVIQREVRVPYYSSVRLVGNALVQIEVGPVRSVTVEGPSNLVERVAFDMRSDELQILTPGINRDSKSRPTVRITSPEIMALRLTGSGDMILTGTLRRPDFEIYNAGSGCITVTTGSVDLLAVRILRSGSVDCRGLFANQVHARIDGSGSADIFAAQAVNVDNTGRGRLRVYGQPMERNLRITGSASPPVEFPAGEP